MTFLKFIFRSLSFFRKQQLSMLAGTILSTAVLTGALIIGDSVKHSLRELVDFRLGETRFALVSGDRFVRAKLAKSFSENLDVKSAALLIVPGIGINPETNSRINSIQVLGIDFSFWQFSKNKATELTDDEAIISESTAQKLNLEVGQEILLRIENVSIIPLNAPFASQEQPSVSVRLKIKAIARKEEMGRFSLKSNQAAPYNVFVSQTLLAEKLKLEGLANTIILSNNAQENLKLEQINIALKESWNLKDASLEIKKLADAGKYELLSNRIFIEDKISQTIDNLKVEKEPVLTYLVNSIRLGNKNTPYSFVSALENDIVPNNLNDNEIVINSWLADDLSAKIGDSIQLDYFIIGTLRNLKEVSAKFKVKSIIPIQNNEILRSLMPSFPGLSNAGHCKDWKTDVPIDLDNIRDKDEEYWNIYKGTPKAYISIHSGQKLWKNQFGNLSAIRFDSKIISPAKLEQEILSNIEPQDFNLTFQSVYEQGIAATVNAVDFGELFLSLSFFVIVAAVLLTILIHGLNIESRSIETGLLEGIGFTQKLILKIRIFESLIIILFGGILGALLGILYNYALLAGLNSVWNEVVRTNMISVYIHPKTLLIGSISGIIVSIIPVIWITRKKLKQTISILIKNSSVEPVKSLSKRSSMAKWIFIIGLILTFALLAYSLFTSVDDNSALFLTSGAIFLMAGIAFVSLYLDKQHTSKYNLAGINSLAIKNTVLNKSRSLATIGLLSLGVFIIFITGANRKTFYGEDNLNQSGTGGYLFWAETSLPILYNLNAADGQKKLGVENNDIFKNLKFSQFHSLSGDDASCLNLNQVQKPRILGVNASEFNERKSFSFASLLDGVDKENPWLALNQLKYNQLIPAVADLTVLTWSLKKSVGDTIVYLNEEGKEIKLLIIGGLNNSIFQGNLLISDSLLVQNFPSISGSKVMLIDAPTASKAKIEDYLNNNLVDYGIEISQATIRLAEFNSVTNTYLAVFMALGGLGVLIGTIGLGIVILRNMLERKPEFALLQAIGFNNQQIFTLVLKENLFLLFSGIVIGSLAAIIGILPSILSPLFEIPGTFVFVLLLAVIVSGLAWIYFPARNILKWNIIRALQAE